MKMQKQKVLSMSGDQVFRDFGTGRVAPFAITLHFAQMTPQTFQSALSNTVLILFTSSGALGSYERTYWFERVPDFPLTSLRGRLEMFLLSL